MMTVAIVPARSGSKGFPHKNIAKIGDMTLIELAVQVGLKCPDIDDVYISTDSQAYETIALSAGANTLGLRPKALASDVAKTVDVVLYMLNIFPKKYDRIVLLQPTSPLRDPKDISVMLDLMEKKAADAVVSVSKIEEPHPIKVKKMDRNGYIVPFIEGASSEVPRQGLTPAYRLNGSLYVVNRLSFERYESFLPKNTLPYLMDRCINIDSRDDYEYLLYLVEKKVVRLFGIDNGR